MGISPVSVGLSCSDTNARCGAILSSPSGWPWWQIDVKSAVPASNQSSRISQRAASWTADGTKRRYPWGDDDPTPARACLGRRGLGPAAVGAHPAGASPHGALAMVGHVWEWTATTFDGYPGFAAFPYREYSEVFFGDEYRVLRGGSWATHPTACRATFRNWDYPIRRQIFCGFRCARDA